MKTIRTPCLAALNVCLLLATNCWGFPGPPQSLVDSWTESSAVVYADVSFVKDVERGQRAILSIVGTLKSRPREQPMETRVFTSIGGCPYPFTFRKGQRIIAFLTFDPAKKMYSPGRCIEADGKKYRRYSTALKKLPGILGTKDPKTRSRLLLDWYVACAENAATRGDGATGISYARHRAKRVGDPLTGAHKARLATAILAENPPGENAAAVAQILVSYPSTDLNRYLLKSLHRSHEVGWSDLTRHAVEKLPKRLGIKLARSTQTRLDEYWDLLRLVHYRIDREAEPERFERDQKRLDVLWGSLSYEIYSQCKGAIDRKK